MPALETEEYLEQRANRASAKKFRTALSQIPEALPAEFDRIPAKKQACDVAGRKAKKASGVVGVTKGSQIARRKKVLQKIRTLDLGDTNRFPDPASLIREGRGR